MGEKVLPVFNATLSFVAVVVFFTAKEWAAFFWAASAFCGWMRVNQLQEELRKVTRGA